MRNEVLNAQAMRKMVKDALDRLVNGKALARDVSVLVNAHGKFTQSAAMQCKYYHQRGEIPEIEYLTEDKRLWNSVTKTAPSMSPNIGPKRKRK